MGTFGLKYMWSHMILFLLAVKQDLRMDSMQGIAQFPKAKKTRPCNAYACQLILNPVYSIEIKKTNEIYWSF